MICVSLASRLPPWASAASPVKWVGLLCPLWLLSALARLAAVWHFLFPLGLLSEGGSRFFLCYSVRLGLVLEHLFFRGRGVTSVLTTDF